VTNTDDHVDPTVRPPRSCCGDVLIVSADDEVLSRANRVLQAGGWSSHAATELVSIDGALVADVVVLDPARERRQVTIILHVLARVSFRPAVVLLLRDVEDLATAIYFSIGCLAPGELEPELVRAVERARRDGRQPRLWRAGTTVCE